MCYFSVYGDKTVCVLNKTVTNKTKYTSKISFHKNKKQIENSQGRVKTKIKTDLSLHSVGA